MTNVVAIFALIARMEQMVSYLSCIVGSVNEFWMKRILL